MAGQKAKVALMVDPPGWNAVSWLHVVTSAGTVVSGRERGDLMSWLNCVGSVSWSSVLSGCFTRWT